jgi:hypothetical protein
MAKSLAMTYALVNTILSRARQKGAQRFLDKVLYHAGGKRPAANEFWFFRVFGGCRLSLARKRLDMLPQGN